MSTILVVDDSSVDRRLVGGLLEKNLVCTVKHATNGAEALAGMKEITPDVVVTDLSMPMMDGLEFVKHLGEHHPDVPVILITAHGSESLAIEALEQGAASYVPKSQLNARLVKSVDEVISLSTSAKSSKQLLGSLRKADFSFELDNDSTVFDHLVEVVQDMLAGVGLCDFTERLQVQLALKEALLNALFHGNLEMDAEHLEEISGGLIEEKDQSWMEQRCSQSPYGDRKIYVDINISPEEARFVIRDEGAGFDLSTVPEPHDPDALDPERGRGLSLMRTFMDELTYNDIGNEVTMVKRK